MAWYVMVDGCCSDNMFDDKPDNWPRQYTKSGLSNDVGLDPLWFVIVSKFQMEKNPGAQHVQQEMHHIVHSNLGFQIWQPTNTLIQWFCLQWCHSWWQFIVLSQFSFKSWILDMTTNHNTNWRTMFPMIPFLIAVYCHFTVSMDTEVGEKLVEI